MSKPFSLSGFDESDKDVFINSPIGELVIYGGWDDVDQTKVALTLRKMFRILNKHWDTDIAPGDKKRFSEDWDIARGQVAEIMRSLIDE